MEKKLQFDLCRDECNAMSWEEEEEGAAARLFSNLWWRFAGSC